MPHGAAVSRLVDYRALNRRSGATPENPYALPALIADLLVAPCATVHVGSRALQSPCWRVVAPLQSRAAVARHHSYDREVANEEADFRGVRGIREAEAWCRLEGIPSLSHAATTQGLSARLSHHRPRV